MLAAVPSSSSSGSGDGHQAAAARPSGELISDYYELAVALYGRRSFISGFTAFLYYSTLFLQMGSYLVVLSQALHTRAYARARIWGSVMRDEEMGGAYEERRDGGSV